MYHLLPYLNCVCCWCLGLYLCNKIECKMYPKENSVINNTKKCNCECESSALLPPTYNEVIIYHQPGVGNNDRGIGEEIGGGINNRVNQYDDLVNPGTCLNASSSPVGNLASGSFYMIHGKSN